MSIEKFLFSELFIPSPTKTKKKKRYSNDAWLQNHISDLPEYVKIRAWIWAVPPPPAEPPGMWWGGQPMMHHFLSTETIIVQARLTSGS
ncbi:hypothetical protein LINGRAHAP2_LOCUS33754 [Linum grandiflorum]